MKDLVGIVDRLQKELTQSKVDDNNAGLRAQFPPSLIKTEEQGSGCAISTANELEILNKVRTYINLNRDYHNYMLKQDNASGTDGPSNNEDQLTNEREVDANEESKISPEPQFE